MKIITIPYSYDNYGYLLICESSSKAAVIDPGEAYPIMIALEKHDVTLQKILCTHHHHDHVGGIEEMLQTCADVEVVCHVTDRNRIDGANSYVDHDDQVAVGELAGSVIYTPGHTLGSICYSFDNILFSGDTVFGCGCGRLFEGSAEQMFESLKSIAVTCDDSAKIFFAHEYTRKNLEFARQVEPENEAIHKRLQSLQNSEDISTPSTLALEKETNPFFRASQQGIKNELASQGFKGLNSDVDVFAQLRELRNSF